MGPDDSPLRFGVVGLSRAFVLMRATFHADERCLLTAAADPRAEAREAFEAEFGGFATDDFRRLCENSAVEVVYVASPHQFHREHAIEAARHGKHLLVEKPLALSLPDCRAIRDAAQRAGVQLIVGPSHGFDAPVTVACEHIASGELGRVRMITALNFTDYIYRPRRAEELDRALGGGVVLGQAIHQVDVVRRLAGAAVESVHSQVGAWDERRPVEGAYQAFLRFSNGVCAQLTYSGYGRYDSDALMEWQSETGFRKPAGDYGAARRRLAAHDEKTLKEQRAYGPTSPPATMPSAHEHFGFVLVSCERGDIRLTPRGVEVFAQDTLSVQEAEPPAVPRRGVIDEVWGAVRDGQTPLHDGNWGEANLATCLAILRSSDIGREVRVQELEDGRD